jgi:hypothetical protein
VARRSRSALLQRAALSAREKDPQPLASTAAAEAAPEMDISSSFRALAPRRPRLGRLAGVRHPQTAALRAHARPQQIQVRPALGRRANAPGWAPPMRAPCERSVWLRSVGGNRATARTRQAFAAVRSRGGREAPS